MMRQWYGLLVIVAASGIFVVSCIAPITRAGIPVLLVKNTPAPATDVPPSEASEAGQSMSLSDILPSGAGRDLFFGNCASCHSILCSVLGQRTVDRWQGVKAGHRDSVSGLNDEDFNTLFDYLAENFNDTGPEPMIPEQLRQQGTGCTPF